MYLNHLFVYPLFVMSSWARNRFCYTITVRWGICANNLYIQQGCQTSHTPRSSCSPESPDCISACLTISSLTTCVQTCAAISPIQSLISKKIIRLCTQWPIVIYNFRPSFSWIICPNYPLKKSVSLFTDNANEVATVIDTLEVYA